MITPLSKRDCRHLGGLQHEREQMRPKRRGFGELCAAMSEVVREFGRGLSGLSSLACRNLSL
jgi:hypothetical protein